MTRRLAALAIGALAACASESRPPAAPPPAGQALVNEELAAVCRTVLCREPRAIHLELADGSDFDTTLPAPLPIVTGPYVTIYPGENVLVEAIPDGDRLTDLVAVETVTHPERTLRFELSQLTGKPDMMLVVRNPFARPVKYRLGMMLPSSDALRGTSSCPVLGGKMTYEHWPHPIFQLVATEFRLLEESSAELKCD